MFFVPMQFALPRQDKRFSLARPADPCDPAAVFLPAVMPVGTVLHFHTIANAVDGVPTPCAVGVGLLVCVGKGMHPVLARMAHGDTRAEPLGPAHLIVAPINCLFAISIHGIAGCTKVSLGIDIASLLFPGFSCMTIAAAAAMHGFVFPKLIGGIEPDMARDFRAER